MGRDCAGLNIRERISLGKDEENLVACSIFLHLVFNKESMTNWIFYRDLEMVPVIIAVQLSVCTRKM